jgi:non-ribosomal peptide synthase protein (TIGR01720 family)
MNRADETAPSVAIIGLAGRFPGARSVEELWSHLCGGRESVSFFSDEEVEASELDPVALGDPGFVKARGVLDGVELFDAAFFGYSPREAEIIDPQQRIFLECAWEALERVGYDSETCEERIGVYAGASMNRYFFCNLYPNREVTASLGLLQTLIGNDKDFLPTRVSYKMNLRGPSINVQTACSTSLVAVHIACQGLLNGECDIALAGGSSVRVPQKAGYIHQPGGMLSPDGHCRAFDARARGTVFSNGVAVVVLKRLEDALEAGDRIYAVVLGSAVNNDGSAKIGFTAPSIESQAEVVAEALAVAGVPAETVTYVEAHGTGTELGDPIEVAALTRAFRTGTPKKRFCALGSIKTNLGHLDAAAGAAGLIKAAMALEQGVIPPSLFFEEPNPKLDLDNSPFFVNTTLREWHSNGAPRRAGVTSLGVGGTNVHVILEEPPPARRSGEGRPCQLLVLSARSEAALEQATANLADHLRLHPDLPLADIAYTLHLGRRSFEHRRIAVCRGPADAVEALEGGDPGRVFTACQDWGDRPLAFLLPGQGAQHAGMASGLYRDEPAFREQVDLCAQILQPHLGMDLRRVLFADAEESEETSIRMAETRFTQPALFVVEYALARLLMEWSVEPQALIGHSLGEYVAACLAGVLSLKDALALVAARGRLLQDLPEGAMLSVALPEEELLPHLGGDLSLAAVNGPARCVAAGPVPAVAALEARLSTQGVECRRLHTSRAFHSPMMEPVLESWARVVEKVRLNPPSIPFVSNVTGTWITAAQATDPGYWGAHLRHTVRFSAGLGELLREPSRVLLEVGPGTTLSTLARQHPDRAAGHAVLSCLGHPGDRRLPDLESLLSALGRLWLSGVRLSWRGLYARQTRNRLLLPTYPFERQRYWVEAKPVPASEGGPPADVQVEGVPPPAVPPDVPTTSRHARPVLQNPYVAPADPLQQSLADVWSEVLGIDRIGVHDNFFELGGDSIIGLQIATRAGRAGLRLTPRQIFDLQTVAGLAEVAEMADPGQSDEEPAAGPSPLVPIQRWLLEQELPAPQHFNQALFLEVLRDLPPRILEASLVHLLAHHDALRLRLAREEGGWTQRVSEPGGREPFLVVDLSALPVERQGEGLEDAGAGVQASLDLFRGPLTRLALFDLGRGRTGRLLWVVHHWAVDYLSWPILLEDLWTACEQLAAGRSVELPATTTRFRSWAVRVAELAASSELEKEAGLWRDDLRRHAARLPLDLAGNRELNTVASARSISLELDEGETQALLREVPALFHTQTEEILLSALVQALAALTGGPVQVVDVEGRGRELPLDGVDLSRTVGWFTTLFPAVFCLEPDRGPGEVLRTVKEQLRRVPREGIGWGLLRYGAAPDPRAELAGLLPAEVMFTYLGRFDPAPPADAPLARAGEPHGPSRRPSDRRAHLLEVSAVVAAGRLRIDWTYSASLHLPATLEKVARSFAEALHSLIAHCRSLEARSYTPSDFPEADLEQADLDDLIAELRGLME